MSTRMSSESPENIMKRITEDFKNRITALKASEKDATGENVDGHLPPPFEIRFNHRKTALELKELPNTRIKHSLFSTPTVSTLPLERLKRTNIRNLLVNVPANGFYLLLRTIERPNQLTDILTIVEDHLGNVIVFQVINFKDPESNLCAEDVLPVGTILVLKEPVVKKSLFGGITLRGDCPSDIIIIDRSHKLYETYNNIEWQNPLCEDITKVEPTSGEGWKNRGNKMFRQKKYILALEAYLVALNYNNSSSTTTAIQLNLSATYLVLGYFESCLKYAQTVLETDPQNPKALFRAGKACCHLRNFEAAKDFFKLFLALTKLGELHSEASVVAAECVRNIRKVSNPARITEIIMEAISKPKTCLDFPDFVGPVEIAPLESKGRGVIAKRDITAGECLVISKAVGSAFRDPSDFSFEIQVSNDFDIGHGPDIRLRTSVVQTVLKNPNTFGKSVYELSTGDSTLDENVKIFSDDSRDEPITDVERIRKIIQVNSFTIKPIVLREKQKSRKGIGTGLFIFPSYFNHSCVPNAITTTYNDILVIHALQGISCGEEITISYYNATDSSFLTRESQCTERHFKCDCSLCDLDRRLSSQVVWKIESLLLKIDDNDELSVLLTNISSTKKQVKEMILEISNIYKDEGRDQLKVPLFRLYLRLAFICLAEKNVSETLQAVKTSLDLAGLSAPDILAKAKNGDLNIFQEGSGTFSAEFIGHLAVAAISALRINDPQNEIKEWIPLLVLIERLCCGGNMETARAKYHMIPGQYFKK